MYLLIYRGHLPGLMTFIGLKTSMRYCMTSVLSVLEWNTLNLALFLRLRCYSNVTLCSDKFWVAGWLAVFSQKI